MHFTVCLFLFLLVQELIFHENVNVQKWFTYCCYTRAVNMWEASRLGISNHADLFIIGGLFDIQIYMQASKFEKDRTCIVVSTLWSLPFEEYAIF